MEIIHHILEKVKRLASVTDGVIFSESKSFEIFGVRVMLTTGRLTTTIFKSKYPLLPEKKSEKGPLLRLFSEVGGGGGVCTYAKVKGVSIKFFGGNTKRPCQDFVLVIEICRVRINS